jgi:hypothetical protein
VQTRLLRSAIRFYERPSMKQIVTMRFSVPAT